MAWYSAEGRKLETKCSLKKIPTAIVYLLCRNHLATMAETKQIVNIQEFEKAWSHEIKVHAIYHMSMYDKQTWVRQGDVLEAHIKKH